jgi:hypothetical protein
VSTPPKSGPLSQADLQAIWESTTDPSFWRPLEAAGDGNGFEAYGQAWAQFERVSEAIDVTTQAMFLLPWSGQSNPPAGDAENATVTLSIARAGNPAQSMILRAGTLVGEQVTDWGVPEGVQVPTGRLYLLDQDLIFPPGQLGPLTVGATAQRPGYGYNNPGIGTIVIISQPGTGFYNIDATLRQVDVPSPLPSALANSNRTRFFLDAIDRADAFIPDHVGQYLQFTAGSNVGKIARIIGWLPPNLAAVPPTGGTVELEVCQSIESFAGHFAGTFQLGEILLLKNGGAVTGYGLLNSATLQGGSLILQYRKLVGSVVDNIVGNNSAATATIDVVLDDLNLTPEIRTASWVILDWVGFWGATSTNPAKPAGGVAGFLDGLGKERNVLRAPGESADSYRKRVSQLADVVTPNAIRRTLNRTIPGVSWCLREVGRAGMPGFFFDLDAWDNDAILMGSDYGDAVVGTFFGGEKVVQIGTGGILALGRALVKSPAVGSVPSVPAVPHLVGIAGIRGTFVAGTIIRGESSGATVNPGIIRGGLAQANRYRVLFDYLHMRAAFYVGLPPGDVGEFGFSYDNHPNGAYDGIGFFDFYDGAPLVTNRRNLTVQQALDKVRAAGVVAEVYLATDPCS